ncbi:MAG: hypothetical protein US49_C0006G0063 [candidate division TM6 bacterium GW2011_GWF2_37_49]|nr:MAG: hypothetical protein US49_C0006G0063 [candidate division TM6 bacterium GW2011_GWF2_37_49]
MNFHKNIMILTILIYSLFGVVLFGAKQNPLTEDPSMKPVKSAQVITPAVPQKSYPLRKLEEFESATTWIERAALEVLVLVATTPQERLFIAQGYANRARAFFGLLKIESKIKAAHDSMKLELNKLSFDENIEKIKARIPSINSAFIKIELLGLSAYVYQSPERGKPEEDKPFGEFAPFVFLTPAEVLELRINVLKDLLTDEYAKASESDIRSLVYKHFKPMAAAKALNKGLNKNEFKKLLKFRVDLIWNADMYPQNRLWFDDYLVAIAKYRLSTVSSIGEKDKQQIPMLDESTAPSVDDILKSKDYRTITTARLRLYLRALGKDLEESKRWPEYTWIYRKLAKEPVSVKDEKSVIEKIQDLQGVLIQKANATAAASGVKVASKQEADLANDESKLRTTLRTQALHDLRILHEGAYNKLSIKFRSEYAINCVKNVLFSAEMITAAVLFGAPITAVLTGASVALGAASVLVPKIKNLDMAQKGALAAKVVSGVPVKSVWSRLFWGTEPFSAAMSAGASTIKQGVDVLQSQVPDFATTFNNAPLPFSSADVCKVSDAAKAIEASAPKVSSMISLQAASSLVAMIGIPILLRYSQNALIDMVWTSPNKKKYQTYYAFLELRNNIADLNSGLERMISARPVEVEVDASAYVPASTAKPGSKQASVRAVAQIIPTRLLTIDVVSEQEKEKKGLAAKEQAGRMNRSRMNLNNMEEFDACLQYFDDYCKAKLKTVGEAPLIIQSNESIKLLNEKLQACYDAKNITESILYDLKKIQILSQKKSEPSEEITALKYGVIKLVQFINDKYTSKFSLANEHMTNFFAAVNKQTIEYANCIAACDALISALELDIEGFVGAITKQLTSVGVHLANLRKACKEKEVTDFNAAIKAYIKTNPKILNAEAKALAQGKTSGWIKNSIIDWDMYFVHSYLMATKADATAACRDNVIQHIYFPNLRESARNIVTDFVQKSLKSEMAK